MAPGTAATDHVSAAADVAEQTRPLRLGSVECGIFENTALNSPDRAQEHRAKIQQVLSQQFDYGTTAQQSLGRHWSELTPAQQRAFIPLFSSLLEQMHTKRIEKYGGKKKSIAFKDETLHADGTASVRLVIVDPHAPTINEDMDYRLQKHQDVWLVHDFLIDGRRASFWSGVHPSSWPHAGVMP